MSQVDLRHLRIFLILYTTRNVTRAAEAVDLSQSAVSVVLAQLREHYNDPLFVRTSTGMEATPRATALAPIVREAVRLLDQSLVRDPELQVAEMKRRFRLCMTDVGQMTFVPRLLSKLQREAPNVSIEVGNLSHDTARQLETGEADLAMGYTEDIPSGFYSQKLFDEGFACIVARDHPRIIDSISIAQLQRELHVKILMSATAHSIVDKILERRGVSRQFGLVVPSFLAVGRVVATSTMLAIVPLRLATIFAMEGNVKIVALPIKFPRYLAKQYWHDRYHRDAGNTWLRALIHATAQELPLAVSAGEQASS